MNADDAHYDLIVLGAGSAGIATAMRAARHGARVALIERDVIGGTCVNVGCVPKKAMWFAAEMADLQPQLREAGFDSQPGALDWERFITLRNAYIDRIHSAYRHRFADLKIEWIAAQARFIACDVIDIGMRQLHAPHIVIATGAKPQRTDIPGGELGIDSNGFFALRAAPKRIAVIGGGYVAAELANMLHALGSDVELFVRGKHLLANFDHEIADLLVASMRSRGIIVHLDTGIVSAKQDDGKYRVNLIDQTVAEGFDELLWAIGREPITYELDLDVVDVARDARGHVQVDEWQNTNQPGIYALGDVTPNIALTPVAVAAGRHLADRLFGGKADAKLDFDNVPTVVFTHPPLASIGLSEAEARARHGDQVRIYRSNFLPMFYSLTGKTQRSLFKLICVGADERIVGLHLLGLGVEEMLQGFAVAIKMGACKRDFDNTIAIHPTSAEEAVLMTEFTL